jgi:hypothetical protein
VTWSQRLGIGGFQQLVVQEKFLTILTQKEHVGEAIHLSGGR